ncbi:tyrosine-type recombinase/integrase [Rubrivirga sp.]|uniref:tyrosine-type recombinase/integrase n=1 Tax=Rubrivirga sp. TaxID=1885344 RepID=UPI003B51B718
MSKANPYRAELPDGTRIERSYRVVDGKKVPRGNWQWVVYDPDRRPTRKRVNLRTQDKGAAMRKALDHAQRRSLGTFDPWADGGAGGGISLAEATRLYLTEKARTAALTTVSEDGRYLAKLADKLPAGALASHVDRSHVEAIVNVRKRPPKGADGKRRGPGPEASPETKKRRRASVQHFFSWAVERGHVQANPAEGVRLPKMTGARRDHVTEAEADAIVKEATAAAILSGDGGGWVSDWVTFGVGTGLRPGEQKNLKWGAVRLAEGTVEVGRGHRVKTAGSRRTVPVRGAALDVLRRLHAERTTEADGFVFTGAKGGPVAVDYLTKRLQTLAERAKVSKNVTAYSLRHAYGTRMASAGVPLLRLAKLMGSSARMIEKHYAHLSSEGGADDVERVFGSSSATGAPPSPAQPSTQMEEASAG